MKTSTGFWQVLVYLCLCGAAFSDSYIVTKEGKGFWTSIARKDEKAVYYIDAATGKEKALSLTAVAGLVPSVQKGVEYKPEEIRSHIDDIRALQVRYFPLTKDLNRLRQEWEAAQKGDAGLAKQIDAIEAGFAASDKGPKAYKIAALDLGMVKFKDVQGKQSARVDALTDKVKSEFVAVGFTRLEAVANTNRISVDDFLAARSLAGALSDAGQKEKAAELVGTIRRFTLSQNAKEASDRFAASRSVDAYLASNDLLTRLRYEVAAAEDQKKIDAMLEGLLRDVAKAQPAFRFDFKGFPMTKDDQAILFATQRFSSRITFASSEIEEQCFVFPLQQPKTIRLNERLSVPLRLVFNRAQPKDRVFGFMVLIPGLRGTDSHTLVLEGLQIKNGHVDVVFSDAFDRAEKGFAPAPDDAGEYGAYISLGYRTSTDGETAQWRPISRACRFPIAL